MTNLVVWTRPKGFLNRIVNWRPALKTPAYRALETDLLVTQGELSAAREGTNQLREKLNTRNEEFERKTGELDNILSSLELPMVMVDRALRITKFNRAAHLLFNISNDDVGFPITQVRARFEIPFLNSKLLKVMEQAEPLHRKIADSQMGTFKQSIVPYKDARGNVSGAIISFTSLSGITDGTDKTLESPALFRAAQRVANLGSFYWAVGTEEVHCSDQLHTIFGSQPAARSTLTRFIDMFAAEDRAVLRSEIATSLQHKRGFSVPLRLQRTDGVPSTVQMEAIYQKASVDDRQTEVLMGILREIGNEQSAPATRSANQNDVASVPVFINAIAEPVLIMNGSGVIQNANEAATRAFGYNLAELAGQSINDLFPAARSSQKWFQGARTSSANVQKNAEVELTGLTRQGRGIALNVTIYNIPETDTLVATLTDQTVARAARKQLMQTASAPSTPRAATVAPAGETIRAVRESLDGPLEIVTHLASIIAREAHGTLFNKRYKECGQEIVDRTARIRTFLGSLDELQMLRTATPRFENSNFNLRDIIADAIESRSATAHAKQISLGVDILPALPEIKADRAAFSQILNGMMDYALEAADEGEHITLHIDETRNAGLAMTLSVSATSFTDIQIANAFQGMNSRAANANSAANSTSGETDTAASYETMASVRLQLAEAYASAFGGKVQIAKNGNEVAISFAIPSSRIAADTDVESPPVRQAAGRGRR